MKSKSSLALITFLGLSLAARAQFAGTSDFSSSTNWLTPVNGGSGGTLTFTGSVLGYTVSSTATNNMAYTAWTLGTAPYTGDWAVSVDVHLATFSPPAGQWINLNFVAFHTQEMPVNNINGDQIDIAIDRSNWGIHPSGFETTMNAYFGGTNTNLPVTYADSSSTDASLAIAFDSTTKIISTYYDSDGLVGGYNWTPMGSYNIGSSTYNWGMGPSDTFTFLLLGSSSTGVAVSGGQAYFDNFAATAVPEPSTYAAIAGLGALGMVMLRRRFYRRS